MRLTLQIKLLPNASQSEALKKTILVANSACNFISRIAKGNREYNAVKLHHLSYYKVKEAFPLTSQMIIRCIASLEGRLKIPFICHNHKMLPFIKGEADLIFRKGKFFLFQTIDVPDSAIKDVEEFIGVDFGQTDIAVTSHGHRFSSESIKNIRKHYSKVRSSLQSKGTKGAKRALKRLRGREARFVSIENHRISKLIVAEAKAKSVGIAIEDLSGIRKTANPKSKKMRTELNRWSFYQLRSFITYKAAREGVLLALIPPAYTSQTCNKCKHRGVGESFRTGKNFSCKNCGHVADADVNAAHNIATWGLVISNPEKSTMLSAQLGVVRLKQPIAQA